jgi:hypothetical protein
MQPNTMPTSISHTRNISFCQPDQPKNLNLIDRIILFFASKKRVESIQKGLKQAQDIQSGKVKVKSFEEAIVEL